MFNLSPPRFWAAKEPRMNVVTNKDAADILFNVGTILELAEDNPYRVRAYRRAARLLLANPEDARVRLVEGKEGKELDLPGLGPRLRRKLGELLVKGRMEFYDEVLAEFPRPIRDLIEIPGVGPKTAEQLTRELGIRSPRGVAWAARRHRLRRLRGIGPVREEQLGRAAEAVISGAA
jgi:DNA polymerase/3'-5' exonuclease PolX